MKLYHRTSLNNLEGIFKYGLIPNFEGAGFIYCSPKLNQVGFGDILLEVETGKHKLSSFDDCSEWEVLCWGRIMPWDIKRISTQARPKSG